MTFFHPIKDMCFSHNCRCGAQFPSKDMIVRLFLHGAALSFPLSPLQSAEHTNIYLPGAQCQEDSSSEFLLHSRSWWMLSSYQELCWTLTVYYQVSETQFSGVAEEGWCFGHRNSLCKGQRKKETEGFQRTEKRGIYQECRTGNRRSRLSCGA